MRLAQIVADGRPGGGTTMVLGLIDELQRLAKWPMTVVSQPGSYLQFEVQRRGLEFVGLDFFTSTLDFRLSWRLARVLRGRHFDVTHLHGLRAAHHAVQWPARTALGGLIYTVHGLHQFHLPALPRALANVAERRVMARAARCIFVSQADHKMAVQWRLLSANVSTEVVPNGIKLALARNRAVQRIDLDVCFVGRFEAPKDPMSAAQILAALCAKGYRCAMAGDGPLMTDCRKLLSGLAGGDRVQLVGALSHERALDLMAGTRVLVMPSRWEGLPILPMEAMALGVPVVASRIPGVEEVMPDGEGGLLVPVGDVGAAISAAITLLNNDDLRQRCADAGRSRVLQFFDRQEMARRYFELYQQVEA